MTNLTSSVVADGVEPPHDSGISSCLESAEDVTSDDTLTDNSINHDFDIYRNSEECTQDNQEHSIPINCIRHIEGCKEVVHNYFNEYTSICEACSNYMGERLMSTPFPHDVCPCCHDPTEGPPLALYNECYREVHQDGYAESPWGSWHLDRNTGKIVCIYLNFE